MSLAQAAEIERQERSYHHLVETVNTTNGVRFWFYCGSLVGNVWHVPSNSQWQGPYRPATGWHFSTSVDQRDLPVHMLFQTKQDVVSYLQQAANDARIRAAEPTFMEQRQQLYEDTGVMPLSPYDSLAGYRSTCLDHHSRRYALDSRFGGIAAAD